MKLENTSEIIPEDNLVMIVYGKGGTGNIFSKNNRK